MCHRYLTVFTILFAVTIGWKLFQLTPKIWNIFFLKLSLMVEYTLLIDCSTYILRHVWIITAYNNVEYRIGLDVSKDNLGW